MRVAVGVLGDGVGDDDDREADEVHPVFEALERVFLLTELGLRNFERSDVQESTSGECSKNDRDKSSREFENGPANANAKRSD